jgi:hypothetical protein
MHNLFIANQAAMQYPELLIDVHGIDPATTPREARALVYLSTVLDGFAEVNGRVYGGDLVKMAPPDCSRRSSRPLAAKLPAGLAHLGPGSCAEIDVGLSMRRPTSRNAMPGVREIRRVTAPRKNARRHVAGHQWLWL